MTSDATAPGERELSEAIESFCPAAPIGLADARRAMDLAQAIASAGQRVAAVRLFDRLIGKAPIKPVFAQFFVTVFDLRLRDLRAAGYARDESDGRVTLTFPTEDGAAWLAVGRYLTRLGDFERALEALQRAAALRPRCHATACFLGQLLVQQRRYDEADEVFAQAERACAMFAATTRFSDAFWRGIEVLGDDPPACVAWVGECHGRPRAVLLLSCDPVYFHRYAQELVGSWQRAHALGASAADGESWTIHFHLVTPDAPMLEQIGRWRAEGLAVAATAETPVLPQGELLDAPRFCHVPTYYACARLRVAPWLLRHYQAPVAISDLDMSLVGDPERVLREAAGADVGLLRYSARAKPLWEEYWLSLLVLHPSPEGRRFAALHASYTEHFLRLGKLVWTLDQAGQASTVAYMARHHPGAKIREMPLDLVREAEGDAAGPHAQPVFANFAASLNFQAQQQ